MKKIMGILMAGILMNFLCADESPAKSTGSLPKFHKQILKNGLEIYVVPTKNNGVVQTNVIYRVGSRNEIMGKSGIAHMLEHMNFKSTKTLKAGEFDSIVRKNGGVNNATTGFDYTHYYIRSSKNSIETNLRLYADLMENLQLKDEEFQPERKVVMEERRWRTDNSPGGYMSWRFFNTAYTYHYHWSPIGFVQDILGWSIDDVKNFHATYYQPQNAALLVVGDVDPKEIFALGEKYFGNIENKSPVPDVKAIEPPQDGPREATVHKTTALPMMLMGYKIPNFEHKDQVALDALALFLTAGKSSVLYKKLIDGKRIANSASAYTQALRDGGEFFFYAVANSGVKIERLKTEILKIIDDVKDGKIAQKDLDRMKLFVRLGYLQGLETVSGVSRTFAEYIGRGNIEPLLSYENDFSHLKLQDLVDVAKKYLVENKQTTIFLKP